MSRKAPTPLIFLLVILLTAALAIAKDGRERKAEPTAVDLHGKTYMAFIDMSDNVITPPPPVGTTDAFMPTYIVFGQYGQVLYGNLVIPSEAIETDAPPADGTDITLECYSIIQGEVNGGTISFSLDQMEELGLQGPIYGDVLLGGEKIEFYVKLPFIGRIDLGDGYLCNQNDHFSGQYLGKGAMTAAPPEVANNVMTGMLFQGTKVTFTIFLYDPEVPDEPETFTGEAQFTPATGALLFDGNAARGEPDVTGTLANGILDLHFSFVDGSQATAQLHFFGDFKKKKMKAKLPKPKTVKNGQVTKVRIKHRYALNGSFVKVDPLESGAPALDTVGITRYDYQAKYIDVWLDVPQGASGKWTITFIGPDGKTVKAKKPVTVK